MTVRELVQLLSQFDGDWPVDIEGYIASVDADGKPYEESNRRYELVHVEAWEKAWEHGKGSYGVTLWGRRNWQGD